MRVDKNRENSGEKRRKIFLTGIGMGMPEMLTARAKEVIDQADCLIGAKRMLECAKRILPGEMQEKKKMMVEYRPEQIAEIIKAEKEDWKIGILLSGDIGFFSGAKKLEKVLEGFADEVILVPGIFTEKMKILYRRLIKEKKPFFCLEERMPEKCFIKECLSMR